MPPSVCSERQGRIKKSVDKKGEEGRDSLTLQTLLWQVWLPTDRHRRLALPPRVKRTDKGGLLNPCCLDDPTTNPYLTQGERLRNGLTGGRFFAPL